MAQHEPESHSWLLNGTKSFVVLPPKSAESSYLYMVVAQTQRSNVQTDSNRATTIFLVDSSTPGVKLGQRHHTIGCRTTTMQSIEFTNVRIPDSCVLGHAHQGNIVADNLLRSGRLRNAAMGMGFAKKVLNELASYAIDNTQCGVVLKYSKDNPPFEKKEQTFCFVILPSF